MSARLPIHIKLSYGIGQVAEGVKNTAFSVFLLFYYNQVLGLPGALAGLALGLATVSDAITDPLLGSISDSFRHRWGRRHLFMYAAVLPLAVSFTLLFMPPAGLGPWGLFAWLLGGTMAVRGAMTLYGVPHMALGAELSTDYAERTAIVAYRNVFGFLGGVLVVVVGWGYFFRTQPGFPEGQLNAGQYPLFGICCGLAAAASVLCSALGTHARIPLLVQPRYASERLSIGRLFGEMREALANPSFRALFIGTVLLFITRGIEQGLGIYMATHFWLISPSEILRVQGAGLGGLFAGTILWVLVSRRVDKRPAFLAGVIVFSIFSLLPPLGKLLGWFPHHDSAGYVPLLATLAVIASLGAAAGLVTSGSMMADIADEHELDTGRRQEGIFFGALLFAVKATSGLGQFIAGWGLDLIDFPMRAAPGTVPSETTDALAILYGPGIAFLAVLSVIVLSRYRITTARHAEIVAALARRAELTATAARAGALPPRRDGAPAATPARADAGAPGER
ncbi:MFS transporter [bacterium]|nr:MFS transporter [bacterium]